MFKKYIYFLILFIVAFIWFWMGFRFLNLDRCHYDEGIAYYGAVRILNGDIPYRDFWTIYAPGNFYFLAVIFRFFGINLTVGRIAAIIILSLTCCSIYIFLSKLVLKKLAFLGFVFSLIWLKSYVIYSRPIQPSMLLCIFSLLSILNYIRTNKKIYLVISGILIGITSLFRQDFGLYVFLTVFIIVLLYDFKNLYSSNFLFKFKNILLKESLLFISAFLVILPGIIYFYLNNALKKLIEYAVIFPIRVYPKVRFVPYPEFSISNIIFYLPFLILLIAFFKFFNVYFDTKKRIDTKTWAVMMCFLLSLFLFNYTFILSGYSHLLPVLIPVILLFIFILDDIFKSKFFKKYKNLGIFIIILIFISSFWLGTKILSQHLSHRKEFSIELKRAKDFYDNSGLALSQIKTIKFIQENTEPDEKIFVANVIHDKVVNSDVMFYFLSERHSPTGYYELHPGLTDTKKIQQKIIKDIKKNNVKYIVQWQRDINTREYCRKYSIDEGVYLLDNFIDRNYLIKKDFKHYIILYKSLID